MPDPDPLDLPTLTALDGNDQGQPWHLHLEDRAGGIALVIRGYLTTSIPPDFATVVAQTIARIRPTMVAVDVSECSYLGSASLAYLVEFYRITATTQFIRIPLIAPSPRVASLVHMLGVSTYYVTVKDTAQAWRAFGRR